MTGSNSFHKGFMDNNFCSGFGKRNIQVNNFVFVRQIYNPILYIWKLFCDINATFLSVREEAVRWDSIKICKWFECRIFVKEMAGR